MASSETESRLEQRIGAAVDGDQHRLEVANVRAHHPQIALVTGAACDNECVAIAESRRQRRKVDSLGEHLSFLAQVAHRVLGEGLERLGDAAALVAERPFQLALLEDAAGRQARAVAVEPGPADRDQLTLVEVVEEIGARRVDQPHASAHEREWPRVREASGLRRSHVHDDADARLDELLGGHAVEIGVVDDRDVVRRQPLDEVLRPPVELRVAGELDEAHRPTLDRNSRPPSMRCSSSRRWASSSCAMRV
jgi:hypothetical protein